MIVNISNVNSKTNFVPKLKINKLYIKPFGKVYWKRFIISFLWYNISYINYKKYYIAPDNISLYSIFGIMYLIIEKYDNKKYKSNIKLLPKSLAISSSCEEMSKTEKLYLLQSRLNELETAIKRHKDCIGMNQSMSVDRILWDLLEK